MNFLHLLNGDFTLWQLNQTDLPGYKIVWRDMLCEGETVEQLGSKAHWQVRQDFLEHFAKEQFDKQFSKMQADFKRMRETFPNYDEVVLWFEYDLFCQINMLALLSWFYRQDMDETELSLVCIGEVEGYPKLVGLGEIDVADYEKVFNERMYLSQEDLQFADNVWKIYCSPEHDRLYPTIQQGNKSKFPYLEKAFETHTRRFPAKKTGLTEIEQRIVQLLAEGEKTERDVLRSLLEANGYYGFGDLQYQYYLQQMQPVIFKDSHGILRLNEQGELVSEGKLNYASLRTATPHYGGANAMQFWWLEGTNELESRSKKIE